MADSKQKQPGPRSVGEGDPSALLLSPTGRPGSAGRETRSVSITTVEDGRPELRPDSVAVEEPLEIRLVFEQDGEVVDRSISITMRTPGNDLELALGFLFTESIIQSRDQIKSAAPATSRPECNVVRIQLERDTHFDPEHLQRNFYTTSSCGVCAKSSLEALRVSGVERLAPDGLHVSPAIIRSLPNRLRRDQSVFSSTGGLHAAGRFDLEGNLLAVREDVGRHNAVDKLIGERLRAGRLPLTEEILMVSGRTSFEIVQKTLRAGTPILAAVSAPSSLAIQLAEEFGLTLLGFVRGNRFNIYSGQQRIRL